MLTHSCPFSDSPGMIRFMRNNGRLRKRDWFFLCEGPEGSGKSTTKDQICRRIDPRLSLEDSIFDIKHLLEVLEEGRKFQVYPIDEAVNIFHNQDWATWQSKAMSVLIRQMRIMRSTWGLASPDFEGLHPYLRHYRVRQRFYHRPVFDADGMGNAPPMPLWKDEWFDYKEQRVVTRWVDLEFDPLIEPLDNDPQHQSYERRKEDNFIRLVREMKTRFGYEEAAEEKRRSRNGAAKKRRRNSPPTTT